MASSEGEEGRRPFASVGEAARAGEAATGGDAVPLVPSVELSTSAAYASMAALDAALGGGGGFHYARHGHPTAAALERAVAALEGTDEAVAAASGMAALHLVLDALAPPGEGHTIVASTDLYGATSALLERRRADGTRVVRVPLAPTPNALEVVARERPRLVLVETIANPLLRVADLEVLAQAVHAAGGRLVVDNTFASPALVRPAALGADAVVESATKYLGGHGDVVAGVVALGAAAAAPVRRLARLYGAVLEPWACYLVLRGLRTLGLRVRRQSESALWLAERLREVAGVREVVYPGLASHPDHAVARRLFGDRGFGGVLTLRLDGGRETAWATLEHLERVRTGPTLGDLVSLALHPATASHRALSAAEREAAGVTEDLVRLSVGIEEPEEILADVARAVAAAQARSAR
ncbi:MAG: aminotransferase class I/II-fold pyridoxal phosphate-dependent enzyme [Firmicutes bacterium]|nr:aminotransferase class I/II-fold pyridoxal phosphate-dependent enzyme [Bacillota bacterium]